MNHRKIADIAHVSTSTVSKALSGSREISEDLAERIRKIAIDIGYFKEKSKRKASNKNKSLAYIAVVCPEIISVTYSRIVTLLKSFIEERGGITAVYFYDFNKEKFLEIFNHLAMSKEIDGVILLSSIDTDKVLPLPTVSFSRYNKSSTVDTIGANLESVMNDIVSYFISMGHTDIGFVGEINTIIKQNFFEKAMQKHGLSVNPDFVYLIERRFEEIGTCAAEKIISQKKRPTAIITAYDEIAVSLIFDLEKAGIQVPGDISVFGMNDIPLAPYVKSSLSTVRFFYDEQVALAVDILYDKIFGENDQLQHLIVNHELVIRDSTRSIK